MPILVSFLILLAELVGADTLLLDKRDLLKLYSFQAKILNFRPKTVNFSAEAKCRRTVML